MELVLVRHGESEANAAGVIQGHFDSPLNEVGTLQARALAASLVEDSATAVYASDLRRAQETGDAIARGLGLPLALDPDLREIDIGLFTGRRWPDIVREHPEAYRRFQETGNWSVVPGAESDEALVERLTRVLGRLRAAHGSERVILVAHGAILRRFLHLLLGLPFPSGVFFELHNASVTEVHLTPRGPTLHSLNRVPASAVRQGSTRVLI